jgi:hypothetical protein
LQKGSTRGNWFSDLLRQDRIIDHSEIQHRASYLKTTVTALLGTVGCVAVLFAIPELPHPWREAATLLLLSTSLLLAVVSTGGVLVLHRQTRELNGRSDLFLAEFSRPPRGYGGWKRIIRAFLGSALRPGDLVVVRDATEVQATLDDQGKLNRLPFMPEMLSFCGQVFVVHRRIDKINDWIAGNEIRRLKNVVTLIDVRCNGTEHGGCDAACHVLWNERWLRRLPGTNREREAATVPDGSRDRAPVPEDFRRALAAAARGSGGRERAQTYVCQITELPRASAAMPRWDVCQYLRPLLNGNIGLTGFAIAALTSIFNAAQALRGGVPYPVAAPQLECGPTPVARLDLRPGERVRVRSKREIGLTLFRNNNRGMWFGRETQRHCGQQYTVRSRVDRIIDERSGTLRQLKTPGIILDGVTGTGEFLRFCPQNEYVFWREIWLERVHPSRSSN